MCSDKTTTCWSERPCKWCMVDNCAAPANVFCFHVLNDASDGAPSRKETSHVLVRLQLRRDVKSIQQPFHTHAKNQINALRILSEIAEKPFHPVPQNFGFGLLRFTLQLPASHCTSFLYHKRLCLPGTRSWAHRKPDSFQKFAYDECHCRPRQAHAPLCAANSTTPTT